MDEGSKKDIQNETDVQKNKIDSEAVEIAADEQQQDETEYADAEKKLEPQNLYDKYTADNCLQKKEAERQEKEKTEYHNCIIIKGKAPGNFIINSGEINGNIDQSAIIKKERIEEVFRFKEKEKFGKFIKTYFNTEYVPVLITLSVLKIIPMHYIMMLSDELKKKLRIVNAEEDNAQREVPNTLLSVEEIARVLDAENIIGTMKSEAGVMEIRCLTLKRNGSDIDINKTLWMDYPAMRQGLIEWLVEISKLKNIRKAFLFQIIEAVAEFCALDFAYAQNDIIPLFTNSKKSDNLYFLVEILNKCIEVTEYKKNVDALLCFWCKSNNNSLWLAAYYLYDKNKKFDFNQELFIKLKKIVKYELEKGFEFSGDDLLFIYSEYSQIPFGVLQEKENMAEIYIEVLASLFAESRTRSEKIRFGYYFTSLLWQDYMEEGYPLYKSLFIESINHKVLREKLKPIFLYLWEKKTFRDILKNNVFAYYICEFEKYHRSWDYMKCFFRMIAFTGNEEDFDNTIRMLEHLSSVRANGETAKQMKDYLADLIESRRGSAKEKRV